MKWHSVFALLLLLCLPAQLLFDAAHAANINDELYYITFGYTILRTGDFELHAMPGLVTEIAALPLLFIQPELPLGSWSWHERKMNPFAREFFFHSGNDAQQLLFWPRLMMVAVAMLLGYAVFSWSSSLFGKNAGLLSLFLYVFSVQALGNANRVLLDLTLSLFFFLAVFFFWRFAKKPVPSRAILAGIMFGLALASKNPAVLLAPILLLLLTVLVAKKRLSAAQAASSFSILLVVAALAVFVTYGFKLEPLSIGAKESAWLDTLLGDSPLNSVITTAIGYVDTVPIPLAHFIKSLGFQLLHSQAGHGTFFLLGQHSAGGWWYYYIVALLVKLQLPLLILLALSVVFWRRLRAKPLDELFLLLPPVFLFLYFSLFVRVNIGISYLLPVFPFLFVFAGRLANLKRTLLVGLAAAVLLAWYAASAIAAAPHYTAYFNEMVGMDSGHKVVVDFDCGQHLPALKNYIDRNGIANFSFMYTGTAEPEYYGITGYTYLYHPVGIDYNATEQLDYAKTCRPRPGTYVIESRVLQNFGPDPDCFAWLRQREPVAKVGYCFFVYEIDGVQA